MQTVNRIISISSGPRDGHGDDAVVFAKKKKSKAKELFCFVLFCDDALFLLSGNRNKNFGGGSTVLYQVPKYQVYPVSISGPKAIETISISQQ